MRTPKALPNEAIERLAKDLKQAKTKAEFQAVQCLWLRVSLGLSADQVATAIGWHPSSVRKLQSLEEEQNLLQKFLYQSELGGILEVSQVKAAYEQAAGHRVPKSTVYRMLARHGWRKIAPRPRHPKSDATLQAEFKKTPTPD